MEPYAFGGAVALATQIAPRGVKILGLLGQLAVRQLRAAGPGDHLIPR
jgi:hypothetical protein